MNDIIPRFRRRFADDSTAGIYGLFLFFSLASIAASFFTGPLTDLLPGVWRIMTGPTALTTDFCAVGGLNGALLASGMLGLLSLALLKFSGVKPSGVTIGAFFLTMGFSYFGKNCLNMLPIVLGSWLFAKAKHEPFSRYVHFGLFGGALAPFVSEMFFSQYIALPWWLAFLTGVSAGALIGFIMPPLSAHTSIMHKGFNLFNAGLSAGLLGFALFAIYKSLVLGPMGLEGDYALYDIISPGYPLFFCVFLGMIFLISVICGALLCEHPVKTYRMMLKETALSCDYTKEYPVGITLMNFGLLGAMSLLYFVLIDAPFTGPTIGSLLCIVCWAGSGSNPLSTLPIFIGYLLVGPFTALGVNAQALCVGVCFATGMAPISSHWGLGWGVLAGGIHAAFTPHTPAIHGGFNIYNGGFTAGLVAIVLIPMLEEFIRPKTAQNIAEHADPAVSD